jgi:hypothetical protein
LTTQKTKFVSIAHVLDRFLKSHIFVKNINKEIKGYHIE